MQVYDGYSKHADAVEAISEATSNWPDVVMFKPDVIFVFHSTAQDPHTVAAELSKRFPKALIAGSTSAGEWTSGSYQNGTLVLLAITSDKIRWTYSVVESLSDFSEEGAQEVYNQLLEGMQIDRSDLRSDQHFCIGFVDGMAGVDGRAVAAISSQLGNIPFLGGCAGDDLKFEKTHVIANGKAYSGGAVFLLAESELPFRRIKHQHFVPGTKDVVITKANESERKVLRLDGMPAADYYAELLGKQVGELDFQVFSDHPVMYRYAGENYVRSITSANDDGSLTFYCAIEEGMVLNLCQHQDMVEELDSSMNELVDEIGQAEVLFMCNCVFRSLEAEGKKQSQALAEHASIAAKHVIGFDTYGELWDGLHINQTLVGLALGHE
ncbi:hypothetical protein MMIC_P0350 [Mariprofundus micogutta]|uniref:FIST N domain protein n=1 Tax=Mariprofundus micogutta TaxID=1921010 RepID=A0A1L8CKI1_9PROT|nr:FIST N-terminal domain-containing protein [Mariprofundus micogutta]GAV19416.1 hypothetical protein MMIC_P0350 [Mariprofundus micogutta]